MYRQTASRKAKTDNGPSSASDTGPRMEQHIPEWENDWMGAWTRESPLFASGASEIESGTNSRQARPYSPRSPEIPDILAASETPESDHSGYIKSPANHSRHQNRTRSAQEEHDQFGYSNWDTRDGPLRDRIRRDYGNSNDRRSMGQSSHWSPQIERATGTPENGNDERPQWWLYSPRSPGAPDYPPTPGTPETDADSPPRQRDVRLTSDYIEPLQIAVERIEEVCRQTAENEDKAPEAVPKTPKYEFDPRDYTLDESFSADEVIILGDTPPQKYEQPFGKGRKNGKLLNVKHEISSPGHEASRQRTYIPRSPITCGSPADSVLDLKRRKHRKRKHSHHHHRHRGDSKSHKRARTDSEIDVWEKKHGAQEAVASKGNVQTPLCIWNNGQRPPKKSSLDRVPRQRPFPTGAVETAKWNWERITPPWRRTENNSATTTNWNRGQRPKGAVETEKMDRERNTPPWRRPTAVATPPREKAFPRGAGEAEKKDQQRNTPPWRRPENNWRNSITNRRGRGGGTGRWNVDKDKLSRYMGSNKTSIEKPPKPTDHSDRRSYSRSPRSTSNWNRGQRPKPDTKFATAPRERAFQRGARDTEKKDQQRNTPPWRRPENNWRNSITNRRGRGGGPGSRGVERDRQNIRYMGSNKNSNLEPSKPIDHFGRRSYSRSPRSTSP